jgi:tetratricopeptide (TPR) repeat protein
MIEEADKYFQAEDYQKAVELFEKLVAETPNAMITLNIGRCYFELKQFEKSLQNF